MNQERYENMILQATSVEQEKTFFQMLKYLFVSSMIFCSLFIMMIGLENKQSSKVFEKELEEFVLADDFLYLTSLEM